MQFPEASKQLWQKYESAQLAQSLLPVLVQHCGDHADCLSESRLCMGMYGAEQLNACKTAA